MFFPQREAKKGIISWTTKSINSQTNNKSSGNDGLDALFYKHISNALALVFLDVCDSRGKLGTMDFNHIYHK